MKKTTVKNIINNNGNTVANQFIITEFDTNGNVTRVIFQSYNSIICIIDTTTKIITFGRDYDYSNTTMRHLKTFLQSYPITAYINGVKDIRKYIASGGYFLNNNHIKVEYNEGLR